MNSDHCGELDIINDCKNPPESMCKRCKLVFIFKLTHSKEEVEAIRKAFPVEAK